MKITLSCQSASFKCAPRWRMTNARKDSVMTRFAPGPIDCTNGASSTYRPCPTHGSRPSWPRHRPVLPYVKIPSTASRHSRHAGPPGAEMPPCPPLWRRGRQHGPARQQRRCRRHKWPAMGCQRRIVVQCEAEDQVAIHVDQAIRIAQLEIIGGPFALPAYRVGLLIVVVV